MEWRARHFRREGGDWKIARLRGGRQEMTFLLQLENLGRKLGAGRALLRYYHTPIGLARRSIAEGGPWEQKRTEAARFEMAEAAKTLTPLDVPARGRSFEVHFLTGAKYWYQTLFCAWSMQANSACRLTPVIYDDGSLTAELAGYIERAIPWSCFLRLPEIEEKLDGLLPAARFPELRRRRLTYPHLRKLTDIQIGARGWTLVLDSDMLFFREPRFVLDWLASPEAICHMADVDSAYGYSEALMEELAGCPIPRRVNVGFCGLKSDAIDWAELEFWCRAMTFREGMSYCLEQALTAMLMAGKPHITAPASDYIVLPSLEEGRSPSAVLHHYVAHSKRSYFQHGWKIAASKDRRQT
jgi:hypothetical protein